MLKYRLATLTLIFTLATLLQFVVPYKSAMFGVFFFLALGSFFGFIYAYVRETKDPNDLAAIAIVESQEKIKIPGSDAESDNGSDAGSEGSAEASDSAFEIGDEAEV